MKKDVIIEIRGVYRQEGDEDEIELFTTGSYYKRNGNYFIAYDESEATGFEGTRTLLKVESNDRVTLSRSGASKSQLIIERGVRHQCHYAGLNLPIPLTSTRCLRVKTPSISMCANSRSKNLYSQPPAAAQAGLLSPCGKFSCRATARLRKFALTGYPPRPSGILRL